MLTEWVGSIVGSGERVVLSTGYGLFVALAGLGSADGFYVCFFVLALVTNVCIALVLGLSVGALSTARLELC